MVSHQKTIRDNESLYYMNRREFEQRKVVHFAKQTARRFREFFEYARYCSWHLRDYLKHSAIAAKDFVGSCLGSQKRL